jgi:L-arabinose isomerase
MLEATGEDYMSGSIHGWFRPPVPVSNFLEAYSRAGGTHHLVLVYKAQVQDILHFGSIMGWSVINLSTR